MEFCIIFAAYFENLLLMKKNINLLKKNSGYDWKFTNCGGVMRVDISTGQDIAHLAELDQKMWTVLACPTKGLEIDPNTLKMLDSDNDGRISVKEIVAAAQWLTTILNNPDLLLRQDDYIPISAINTDTEEGGKIERSIRQILSNLGLEKDSISIADTADILAIFNNTRFNGDGIITLKTTDDDALKAIIQNCMDTIGSKNDRSGEVGIDTEILDEFYKQCADYKAWRMDGESRKEEVFPFGDDTDAAWKAITDIKAKVDDYFVRCNLGCYNNEAASALDVSVGRIEAISEKNLSTCMDEIATYPLARISADKLLHLDCEINPAWTPTFAVLKTAVLDKCITDGNTLSETRWNEIVAMFSKYVEWKAAKPVAAIEALGDDRINEIIKLDQKESLLTLITQDLALESEANEIETVDKLLHLYRDFYLLLKNFISFVDFYDKDRSKKAIFQAGTLYLDQRSCELCMKVNDMAKHNVMADFSGMYLIYCDCVSKQKNEKMTIVAVLTNGEVNDIMVGKNALFYDRNGVDWDAQIVKIIDNPISIKQAFWSPYRKFANFIKEQVNKFASSQDEKVTGDVTGKISEAGNNMTTAAQTPTSEDVLNEKKAKAFDIAKFCGIFAAIGLALGVIGGLLKDIFVGFIALRWWQMPLAILGIMLIISGPAMLIAWLKLRRRNLAPVLDANGWTVNARAYISIPFGATLTDMAKFPKIKLDDPFDTKKKTPVWRKILYIILVLAVIFAILYFTNKLAGIGLPFHK